MTMEPIIDLMWEAEEVEQEEEIVQPAAILMRCCMGFCITIRCLG